MTFNRDFQIWFYTPSHGLLLLRSQKRKEGEKRIDIVFYDVWALECRTIIKGGLSIEQVDRSEISDRYGKPDDLDVELRAYLLKGLGWEGYVVAGPVEWIEDDLEYWEPSSIEMNLDISANRHLFKESSG